MPDDGRNDDRDRIQPIHALDGGAYCVIRHRPGADPEPGVITPLQEGVPITGEIFTCEPRDDGMYDVHPIDLSHGGPAMVNSDAYKRGWDSLFGHQMPPAEA